jgi:hypothetical protein
VDDQKEPSSQDLGQDSGKEAPSAPINDQALNEVLVVGLCRTITKLMTSLVMQGALDREKTIRDFEDYLGKLGHSDVEAAARMWTKYLLGALQSDPTRPPPAPVLKFPSRE